MKYVKIPIELIERKISYGAKFLYIFLLVNKKENLTTKKMCSSLGWGIEKFHKNKNELIKGGMVKVEQLPNDNGGFGLNKYTMLIN